MIKLNGKDFDLQVLSQNKNPPPSITIDTLIKHLGLKDQRMAIEVNRVIVSKSHYQNHRIQSGDEVEIIQAVGGG